ncbi:hypothetical protein [Spirillospora sp. NPDC029432]|uniref:VMAP-C domain-containing protein n=1 Tax=Spirillospora sp. NPDC029432 TaxID=3154599 RepID=UPI0034513B6B
MVRSLDVADQRRLVTALLQIDGMRVRSTRDLCITVLERGLGRGLELIRHEQDMHDVWQLVDACLTCPGGVHMLVDALWNFYGDSLSVRAARAVVEELLPEPLLQPAERRELYQLVHALEAQGLNAVYFGDLPALYRNAVGPLGPALGGNVWGIRDFVAYLEEVPLGADGVPPLLTFVTDLSAYAKGPVADALDAWTGRAAARFGVDRKRLRRPGALPAGRGAGPAERGAYLVIECRPDGADFDRFLVTAWLQFAGEPGIMLRCDEEPLPLGRLPALVESLLVEDHRVAGREVPDLTIEFVLPRALVDRPFDQFQVSVAGLPRRLGIEYPVVLRSLDRLRHRALHHNWRRKWERLRDDPENAAVHVIRRPGEYGDERLFTLLSDHATAGLALAFPPGAGGPDAGEGGPVDELWIGLQAGVPVVVWCRDGRGPDGFDPDARALLDSGDLLSLPRRVRDLRRAAVLSEGPDEHLGLHLALIFDDADRVPEPYVRLEPPT